jgi:hypothetical protein
LQREAGGAIGEKVRAIGDAIAFEVAEAAFSVGIDSAATYCGSPLMGAASPPLSSLLELQPPKLNDVNAATSSIGQLYCGCLAEYEGW